MFQSRKRFRHCWSRIRSQVTYTKAAVSIAKAIPSLLEPAAITSLRAVSEMFQSRKRFRHCWSVILSQQDLADFLVSIAKAIPSLLELHDDTERLTLSVFQSRKRFRHCWSVAYAVVITYIQDGFNRESDSVTVGALEIEAILFLCPAFQSRKRFRHCWSVTR